MYATLDKTLDKNLLNFAPKNRVYDIQKISIYFLAYGIITQYLSKRIYPPNNRFCNKITITVLSSKYHIDFRKNFRNFLDIITVYINVRYNKLPISQMILMI